MQLEYTCFLCKEEFISETPVEEALAEYNENFPDMPESKEHVVFICDDCYLQIFEEL